MTEPYKRKRELPIGVYLNTSGRYMAIVRHKGKRRYLGMFDTVEEAAERRDMFKRENPPPENNLWKPGDIVE